MKRQKQRKNKKIKKESRTKACIGNVTKGSSDYEYLINIKDEASDCKTVTYTINDNFEIKYEYELNSAGLYSKKSYVNDTDNGDMLTMINDKIYIIGNTMVVGIYDSATVKTALFNVSGEQYFSGSLLNEMDDYKFEVTENELEISAIIYAQDGTDYLAGIYSQKETTCSKSLEEVANAYGLTPEDALETKYTYILKEDGLFETDNPIIKTSKTIRTAYEELCN